MRTIAETLVTNEKVLWIKKLYRAISFGTKMVCARMFGDYMHSGGGHNQPNYARYKWRGEVYFIPTSTESRDD